MSVTTNYNRERVTIPEQPSEKLRHRSLSSSMYPLLLSNDSSFEADILAPYMKESMLTDLSRSTTSYRSALMPWDPIYDGGNRIDVTKPEVLADDKRESPTVSRRSSPKPTIPELQPASHENSTQGNFVLLRPYAATSSMSTSYVSSMQSS